MGIDKSMHESGPIVVIDGTVYQYGKSPEFFAWSGEKGDPPHWLIEHHNYPKDRHDFNSEQEMTDYIDGLPESDHPPIRYASSGMGWEDYWEWVGRWRHELAERKRSEKADQTYLPPTKRFAVEARRDIDAVLDKHLAPFEDWDDPYVSHQVDLIIRHHLRLYREATGWKPPEEEQPFDEGYVEPKPPLYERLLEDWVPDVCDRLSRAIRAGRRRVERLFKKRPRIGSE